MKRKALKTIALASFALVVILRAAWQVPAQEAKTAYPIMAPLDQYLTERGEITLAPSAAPRSISQDVEIMVLSPAASYGTIGWMGGNHRSGCASG
jgi:hypothetical protein